MTASLWPFRTCALAGVISLTVWVAGVQAQAPGAPQSPQVPPRAPDVVPEPPSTVLPTNPPGTQTRKPDLPETNRSVAVIGCLEAARGMPNEPLPSPIEDFILTDARVAPPPAAAPGATSAPASSPDALEGRLTFRVTGLRPERLRPFLNQHVEITGEFEGRAGLRGAPSTPPIDPSSRSTRAVTWPELKASNITMLAATCPGR